MDEGASEHEAESCLRRAIEVAVGQVYVVKIFRTRTALR
jgi:hypothetical protein